MRHMGQDESVTRYYDQSTALFTRYGPGRGLGAIHRPVWGPGVSRREEAIHYSSVKLLAHLQDRQPASVLDLGCGVGGTLRYLSERYRSKYTGITISPKQAQQASSWLGPAATRSGSEIVIHTGDFTEAATFDCLETAFDVMYAIESFVHVEDPGAFFQTLSQVGRPGGSLILIDDFQKKAPVRNSVERSELEKFIWGWRAPSVLTRERLISAAESAGFELEDFDDWTAYLSAHGLRDYVLRAFSPVLSLGTRRSEWCRSMVGGNALKQLLRREVIGYGFFRFSLTR